MTGASAKLGSPVDVVFIAWLAWAPVPSRGCGVLERAYLCKTPAPVGKRQRVDWHLTGSRTQRPIPRLCAGGSLALCGISVSHAARRPDPS